MKCMECGSNISKGYFCNGCLEEERHIEEQEGDESVMKLLMEGKLDD